MEAEELLDAQREINETSNETSPEEGNEELHQVHDAVVLRERDLMGEGKNRKENVRLVQTLKVLVKMLIFPSTCSDHHEKPAESSAEHLSYVFRPVKHTFTNTTVCFVGYCEISL